MHIFLQMPNHAKNLFWQWRKARIFFVLLLINRKKNVLKVYKNVLLYVSKCTLDKLCLKLNRCTKYIVIIITLGNFGCRIAFLVMGIWKMCNLPFITLYHPIYIYIYVLQLITQRIRTIKCVIYIVFIVLYATYCHVDLTDMSNTLYAY